MAYKSLIDYYGGGMVRPSDGYQLGGLIAGAGRQRDYSGELRNLQQLAEQSARRKQKAQKKGGLLKTALGIGGTLLGGPMGAALGSALGQALGERSYKGTEFGGGKYAQDIRGQLGKQEKAYKGQSGARIGLAGLSGYMGGKAGGLFGKAASGIKGGIGQVKDIAGFLKEGGTMGDVLGGYAQKAGESGIFGDSFLSRGLLGAGAKAGITPTITSSMKRTMTDAGRKKAFESAENLLTAREGRYKIPGSTEGEWAVPDVAYARKTLTPDIGYGDLAEGPDIEEVEKIQFGATEREMWGSQTGEERAQEAARYQPWEALEAPSPSLAYQGQGPPSSLMGPAPQQQPVPSMAGSLMPDMPPVGFSGQDIMVGEAGVDEFEPFTIPSLLGGDFPGYEPDLGSYKEFASDWMPAGLQTAGGLGYQGGGLVDYMAPRGYQDGGYATSTDPVEALKQMGMDEVAYDSRLKDYLEDLPKFGMGYEQQLGDVTAGGRAGLMDISQQARTQQAGAGFAGSGAGVAGQAQARKGLERSVETGRRGVVEGYQADLLSAVADIEAKGGFEFSGRKPGGGGPYEADTPSGGTPITDASQYSQVARPSESGTQAGQVSGSGEWIWNGTSWVPAYIYISGGGTTGTAPPAGGYKASDVRVKNNIDYLFSLDNGIPIYLFKYIGSDELNIGTIAQEAEKIIPEAVIENADGIKYVNYDIIYRQGV